MNKITTEPEYIKSFRQKLDDLFNILNVRGLNEKLKALYDGILEAYAESHPYQSDGGTIEELAKVMHDAWRAEKIKIGWHTRENCTVRAHGLGCVGCHPCVGEWESLTDDEKKLPMMNASLAYGYLMGGSRYEEEFDEDDCDLYTVEEWSESVRLGLFGNYDGSGYWAKDGLKSSAEVFGSPQLDATHVAWYNK